jgi:hypothetical protein
MMAGWTCGDKGICGFACHHVVDRLHGAADGA